MDDRLLRIAIGWGGVAFISQCVWLISFSERFAYPWVRWVAGPVTLVAVGNVVKMAYRIGWREGRSGVSR